MTAAEAIRAASAELAASRAAIVPSDGDYLLAAEAAGTLGTEAEVDAVARELARSRVGGRERARAARIWILAYRREGLKGLPSHYNDPAVAAVAA